MVVPEGYKQTEVGVIPEDWEVKKVLDVSTVKRGAGSQYTIYTSESNGVRFIRINDFFENNPVYVKKTKDISRFAIEANDLLFAGTGNSAGASYIPKIDWVGMPHSYNAPRIRVNESFANKRFLLFILQSHIVINQQRALFVGAAQPFLDISAISGFLIPLPPLPEQDAIAEALSDVDALIAQTEKLIEKKKAIKQGVMQELLKPKEGWETRKLTDIVKYIHGKAHEQFIVETGKYEVVNSKFISTNGIIKKYSNVSFLTAKKDDILTVLSDLPNGKALAKCFYIESDDKYAVNQRICIWRSIGVHSKFLYYILNRHPYFLSMDDGVSQTHILNSHIEKFYLPIPSSTSDQIKIANILWDIDINLISQESKLQKLKLQKQGMMQALLTGKIRLI